MWVKFLLHDAPVKGMDRKVGKKVATLVFEAVLEVMVPKKMHRHCSIHCSIHSRVMVRDVFFVLWDGSGASDPFKSQSSLLVGGLYSLAA